MSARRRDVTPAEASGASQHVCALLLETPWLRSASQVALYAALSDELPTRPLFDALRRAGIVPRLPRVASGARLEFAPVERWDELVAGRYGVLEPPEALGRVELLAGDAVVVPGVAFDEAGHRLGRGMGYYDRTFSDADGPLLVGLAYEFQILPSVPSGDHDRGMDAILTERRVRRTGRGTP